MNRISESSQARFWLLQSLGWLAFFFISALGGLPLHEGRRFVVYYAALTVAGFAASVPLRYICGKLWKAEYGWPRRVSTLVVLCYLMGLAMSSAAALAGTIFGTSVVHPWNWKRVVLIGLSDGLGAATLLIAWSAIYFAMKQWEASHLRDEQIFKLQSLAREAELRALRYEITPHFLFNTLNGISTLVGEGENLEARRMIALLGDFLRTTLDSKTSGDVTLEHEMRHMEQYLAIEQVRLGERLAMSLSIAPEVMNLLVPNLLLQPLVENAVRHGIARCNAGGLLEMKGLSSDGAVIIRIRNSVATSATVGMETVNHGLGLTNTRERLLARYGPQASLEIHNSEGQWWEVVLTIPREESELEGAHEDSHRR